MVWPWECGTSVDFAFSRWQKTSDRISVFQVLCFLHVSDHLESDCIRKFLPNFFLFYNGFVDVTGKNALLGNIGVLHTANRKSLDIGIWLSHVAGRCP